MNVIALAGRKGTGKSTIASWLVKERGYTELSLAKELKMLATRLFPRTITQALCDGLSEVRDRPYTHEQQAQAVLELQAAQTYLRIDPDGRELIDLLFSDAPKKPGYREVSEQLFQAFFPHDARLKSPRRILQFLGTEWGRTLWEDVWLNAVRREVEANKSATYVIPDCRFANEARYLRDRLGAKIYWVEAATRVPDASDAHASEPTRRDLIPHCTGEINNAGDIASLHKTLSELYPEVK